MPPEIDDRAIEMIVERFATVLREELESLATRLAPTGTALTVEQVAERFGVARSTVYAHWREWGGYKLGDAQNTAIRFPPDALPQTKAAQRRTARAKPRRKRPVLRGVPRLTDAFDETS
jgi:transposase-like protein